jgi:hypothetical protein
MKSFELLKSKFAKRKFIVCWLYKNKQTMFNGVPSFGYERIITKEEASKMI